MIKPIRPEEVGDYKIQIIPDFVFKAFNDLIAKGYNNGSSTVKQRDVMDLIKSKHECTDQYIFDQGWLNIEEAYKTEGWLVKYNAPDYTESFPPAFKFTVNKNER